MSCRTSRVVCSYLALPFLLMMFQRKSVFFPPISEQTDSRTSRIKFFFLGFPRRIFVGAQPPTRSWRRPENVLCISHEFDRFPNNKEMAIGALGIRQRVPSSFPSKC